MAQQVVSECKRGNPCWAIVFTKSGYKSDYCAVGDTGDNAGDRQQEASVREQNVIIHCRVKVHTSWDRIGVSIRHCQVFQNVKPALHGNYRPDNVIPVRNQKSREKIFAMGVIKDFWKTSKEKDSHNRS